MLQQRRAEDRTGRAFLADHLQNHRAAAIATLGNLAHRQFVAYRFAMPHAGRLDAGYDIGIGNRFAAIFAPVDLHILGFVEINQNQMRGAKRGGVAIVRPDCQAFERRIRFRKNNKIRRLEWWA